MTVGRSTPELFSEIVSLMTKLFRTEIRLAGAELGEKVSQAVTGVVLAVVGAIFLLSALFLLLGAAVDFVATFGFAHYIAALIVGGVVALVGILLVLGALRNLKGENLLPKRTLGQFSLRSRPARAGGPKVT